MKVEQSYTISGVIYTKEFDGRGVAIYIDHNFQEAKVACSKTGDVLATIMLNPSYGEGGGGDLSVTGEIK